MPLFNRIASITVGERGQETGLNISDLRMVFDIKKTLNTENNTADIEIYNLNKNSRELFTKLESLVTLSVGYSNYEGDKVIFVGNIVDYEINKNKGDIATKIKLGDGSKAIKEKSISNSYKEGTSAWNVLSDLVDQIGLPTAITNKIKTKLNSKSDQYANGLSISGKTSDQLSNVVKKLGLEWSVQNNILNLIEAGGTTDKNIYFFDESSGLIGTPKKKAIEEGTAKKKGWEILTVLFPEILPSDKIGVQSREIDNTAFRVESIEHKGDTHGQQWESLMFVTELINE